MERIELYINLLIHNYVDRGLLNQFFKKMNYTVCSSLGNCTNQAGAVGMIIADEINAKYYLKEILTLKTQSVPVYLPLVILLRSDQNCDAWLQAGFDEVLRTPITKKELIAKLNIFDHLRTLSAKKNNIIFEKLPVGIYYMDVDRRILSANPAFIKIVGYKNLNEISHKRLSDMGITPSTNREDLFIKVHEAKTVMGQESFWKLENGQIVYVRENITFFEDIENKLFYYIGTVEDLTAIIESSEDKDALILENRNILMKAQVASAASIVKSAFLAEMSHELRTPLNSIIGFSQLLYSGMVGKIQIKQKKFLGNILSSSAELLLLINNILDLSKIESGKMAFIPKQVGLEELVRGVLERQLPSMQVKNISYVSNISSDLKEIIIDPNTFIQVMNNFISNSIKFSSENSQIIINIARDTLKKNFFRISVTDTGIGIMKKDLKKLFTPFKQLEQDTTKFTVGTGLGLAITRKIVEAQGGKVGIKSTIGKGSTFYAILPLILPKK